MRKNSNAYTLIKSLTMSEKRYFKIFSERHTIGGENKYVSLFNLLEKATLEDDEAISKELRAGGINPSFLSADKNYLYQLILKSLNDFHYSKTLNLKLKETLLSIEILFYKGLYAECLKLIGRAEEQAAECENFALMIDVLTWKKKCSGYSLGLEKAAAVNKSIDKYISLLNNLKQITDLYYESNLLQSQAEKFSKTTTQSKFKKLLQHPLLKNEKQAASFTARIFYNLIYANYYLVSDNPQKEYEYLKNIVSLMDQSKTYAPENPLDYVSVYNRLLTIEKFINSNSFFSHLKNLRAFAMRVQIRKELIQQRVFIHGYSNELDYYLHTNEFKKALSCVRSIEVELSEYNFEIEPYHLIYFYYLHAVALIYTGEFKRALKFINKTLNEFTLSDRPQVYIRMEVLNVILHYELGNTELCKTLARQLISKNKKADLLQPYETDLIQTLVKIVSEEGMTKRVEQKLFSDLKEEIDKLIGRSKDSQDSLLLNYSKWLMAKAKGTIVSEIYE